MKQEERRRARACLFINDEINRKGGKAHFRV